MLTPEIVVPAAFVLTILYEDDVIVAVHKPAGLMVHRSYVDTGETQFLLQLLRDQLGCYVYPVHRLDRPTSGVILFAKSSEIAAILADQFSARGVAKTYQALVRGFMPEHGVIDYPLKVIKDKKAPRKYVAADKPAQSAVTHYRQLKHFELGYPSGKFSTSRYALIEVQPLTGRTHQIRRHLKHVFHPIIGDTRYGDNHHTDYFRQQYDCQRLLLAATHLSFRHPVSLHIMNVQAPLESTFRSVLDAMASFSV